MKIKELQKNLADDKDISFWPQADLSLYSSMRLAAQAPLAEVRSVEALTILLKKLQQLELPYLVIGLGSNLVLKSEFEKILIKISFPIDRAQFLQAKDFYHLPASTTLGSMTQAAIKHGLSGWQVFTGIPASLGGAIAMNAGTELGEIGTIIREVTLLRRSGLIERITISQSDIHRYFSYRQNHFLQDGDIILSAVVTHEGLDPTIGSLIKEYLQKRAKTQPLDKFTCGCVFKNFSTQIRAGKCIDLLNLKGLEYNGLRISPIHGNFIENIQNGSSADFQIFVKIIQEELKLNFGVDFELEVVFS